MNLTLVLQNILFVMHATKTEAAHFNGMTGLLNRVTLGTTEIVCFCFRQLFLYGFLSAT